MSTFVQDLRYAFRTLIKNPGFTTVAVLTLALGIGANVATYSVVYGVLLKPLPFPQPDQLVRVFDDQTATNDKDVGMSVPELADLQERSGVFREISTVNSSNSAVAGGDRIVRAESLVTSPDYFTLLGSKPELGRVYTQQDAVPGFLEPVVISNGFWRRYYGSDPKIIGRKMRLDGDMYTIVGVMPAGFRHPGPTLDTDVEVWLAAGFAAQPFPTPPDRSQRVLGGAIARLKPGLTVEQAQVQLNTYVAQLTRAYPERVSGSRRLGFTIGADQRRSGRTAAHGTLHPVGRGRIRPLDRVREHREFVAGTFFVAAARNRHSLGDGRRPRAIDATVAHREHAAVRNFRRRRARDCAAFEKCNRQPRSGGYSSPE